LIVVSVVLCGLGVVWGLWVARQHVRARALVWTAEEEASALELAASWGMREHSARTLFGRRLVQAWGERGRLTWQLEVCTSEQGAYVRLIGQPEEGLDQGVRIMREASGGALGWMWRLREVQLGEPGVDARLVLLARDEERLRVLLGTQLKDEVLELESRVDRMELGDDGLFVHVGRACTVEQLAQLIQASMSALERLEALSRAWGGVSKTGALAYGDAIKGDFDREEETALETIALADPGSTTGRMTAVGQEAVGSAEGGGSRGSSSGTR
jgi:hypothetical protein